MDEVLKKFKRTIVGKLLLAYVVLTAGLITNFIQLLTLLVWPFDRLLYRKLNYYLTYIFYANYTFMAQWWSNSKVELFMKEEDVKYLGQENVVHVLNHIHDVDWILGLVIVQNLNTLGGSKIVFKHTVRYFPIFGWAMIFGENIFLKRSWEEDSKTIGTQLNSILTFPEGYHFNINLFSEGTRYTEAKHKASMEVARAKGLTELKHHLLPRTKGFTVMMKLGKDKIDSIYDCTLALRMKPDGTKPNIQTIVNGDPIHAQLYLKRIPMKDVPTDDEAKSAEYLHKMYEHKDQVYDKFLQVGDYRNVGLDAQLVQITPDKYDLYLFIMWATLLLPVSLFYLFDALWYGSLVFKLAVAGVTTLTYIVANILIKGSMVESTSSFGLKKTK